MQNNQPLFTGPGPDAIFAAALEEGKLLIQHCNACSKHVFYPRVICPHCGSPDFAAEYQWRRTVVPGDRAAGRSHHDPMRRENKLKPGEMNDD